MYILAAEVSSMLKVEKLEAYYGESIILNQVDLKVPKGQIVCLIGRNGVGKTTFLKSLMGLVKTPKGSIKLENSELIDKPTYYRARRGFGYVPQGRDIFPQLTVYENLLLGLEVKGGKGEISEKIYELFPVLKSMLSRKGGDLSGGQQQQLAIARALAADPKLLILDEPTEGIQPSIIQEIGRVIKRLKAEGHTIFIVEQYLEFVMGIADYYYVMEKGRIVAEGLIKDMDKEDVQRRMAI